MRDELTLQSKQTFQVVALLATIFVVGIHYKTDIPDTPLLSETTGNEIAQEYLFGILSRVAVPLFAFAAGFFYFRNDDGSWATYRKKFSQRCRSVALPYFIVASIAMVSWLTVRRFESDPVELTTLGFLTQWILHPPAQQLWFLRDLMVLVAVAPLIRWSCLTSRFRGVSIAALTVAWVSNWQVFPTIAGWYLLNIETLLFFCVGCTAVRRIDWINAICQASPIKIACVAVAWLSLAAIRLTIRPDFDIWYVDDYSTIDLTFHQASIVVGCLALFMIASRLRLEFLFRLSGASFFVFLVHEFPLRAVVDRATPHVMPTDVSCWVVVPLVTAICYATALWSSRRFPTAVSLLTGGRTPAGATRIASVHSSASTVSVKAS